MFLHIGGDTVLCSDVLIGIFDLDKTSRGRDTLEFLQKREREGRLLPAEEEALPRSFAVTERGGTDMVYLSPVTTGTLAKRAER